jgi:hypothetical protein
VLKIAGAQNWGVSDAWCLNQGETRFLGVSPDSIEGDVCRLPYVKVEGLVRSRPEDLSGFVESRRESLPALPSEPSENRARGRGQGR